VNEKHGIGTRTLRGMFWAYGAYFGGRLVVLGSTAVLARLLSPRDFGLVALALVFMTFMDALQDLGLGEALIVSSPGEETDRAQTVFSWTVVFGFSLTVLTAALSPLIADFFRQPGLRWLLSAIGVNFFVRSLGATHYALARKDLNYRVRTVSELAEVLVRGTLGISLAIAGFGAWSLTIGFIAGVLASTASLIVLVDFRPRLRLTRRHLKDLMKFGGVLTLVDIGSTLTYNLDYVFVGRVLGAASLGLYTIGFRLPELVILNLANVAADVLFPAYSAVDAEHLRDAYLVALRYVAMATLPAAVTLILLARPIILVAFGHHWTHSITVMQVITLYTMCVVLTIPSGSIFKVTGRAWIMLVFSVPGIAVLFVGLLIFAHDGILAVAWTTTGMQATALPFEIWWGSRQLGVPVLASLQAIAPTVIAAAGMAAVIFALATFITVPILAILAGTLVGSSVYLGLLFLTARDSLERLRAMAFPASVASS
jgi:O-antigen/teichoic acid export membrane protein